MPHGRVVTRADVPAGYRTASGFYTYGTFAVAHRPSSRATSVRLPRLHRESAARVPIEFYGALAPAGASAGRHERGAQRRSFLSGSRRRAALVVAGAGRRTSRRAREVLADPSLDDLGGLRPARARAPWRAGMAGSRGETDEASRQLGAHPDLRARLRERGRLGGRHAVVSGARRDPARRLRRVSRGDRQDPAAVRHGARGVPPGRRRGDRRRRRPVQLHRGSRAGTRVTTGRSSGS